MFLAGTHGWYLVGWCRLRADLRAFRMDRIVTCHDTGEPAPVRPADAVATMLPDHMKRVAALV
jgi:predicted DNA-binding transcriptional regulator YafY